MISPTSPRSTASGLRSPESDPWTATLPVTEVRRRGGTALAHDVERTGDEDASSDKASSSARSTAAGTDVDLDRRRMPRPRAAAATSIAGMAAAGVRAAGDDHAPRRPRRQRPSISTGSRPSRSPTRRQMRPATSGNSSSSTVAAEALGAVGVVGRRRGSTRGWRPTTSNRPGSSTSSKRLGHHASASSGSPKNASAAASASRRVVGLVRAVEREEEIGYERAGRAHVEQPPADRDRLLSMQPKSRSRCHVRPAGPRARKTATQLGVGLAEHDVAVRLDDARLLLGDVGAQSAPRTSVWSRPTFVTTATSASTTLVASQRPSSPTSTTATSTALSANQLKAAAVTSSKYDRRHSSSTGSSSGQLADEASANSSSSMGSPFVAMRSLIARGAGWCRCRPSRPCGSQQRGQHPRRRALAVGAGEVDDR